MDKSIATIPLRMSLCVEERVRGKEGRRGLLCEE